MKNTNTSTNIKTLLKVVSSNAVISPAHSEDMVLEDLAKNYEIDESDVLGNIEEEFGTIEEFISDSNETSNVDDSRIINVDKSTVLPNITSISSLINIDPKSKLEPR